MDGKWKVKDADTTQSLIMANESSLAVALWVISFSMEVSTPKPNSD